jgi:hypothetical protein
MRARNITLPALALVGVTRGMIGFGAGLLVSPRLPKKRRKLVGSVLLAVGALSTIPIALRLFRRPAAIKAGPAAYGYAGAPPRESMYSWGTL